MNTGVNPDHKELITKIIKTHLPEAKIIAFGSRIRGGAKKYSDLDICIDAGRPIDFLKLSQLEEAFAATDIPYKVDIVDMHSIDLGFKAHVLSYGEKWN